jgi:hypothetical protein
VFVNARRGLKPALIFCLREINSLLLWMRRNFLKQGLLGLSGDMF